MNIQKRFHIPLAELHYEPFGIQVPWDDDWVNIPPKEQKKLLPDTFDHPDLLEAFKTHLDGEIDISFYLHLPTPGIDDIKVQVEEPAAVEMARFTERIEGFVRKIESLAAGGSLTLKNAQDVLGQCGFGYGKDTLHEILSKVVNAMPAQERAEKVEVGLSDLTYHTKSIQCLWEGTRYKVSPKVLPSQAEVDPLVEHVKSHLGGALVLHIKTEHLEKWDRKAGVLRVGQGARTVTGVTIDPDDLRAFNQQRGDLERLISAVQAVKASAAFTRQEARRTLKDLGSRCTDEELDAMLADIVDRMPIHTHTARVRVALAALAYQPDGFAGSHDGHSFIIPHDTSPFDIGPQWEAIKSHLAGDLSLDIEDTYRRTWDRTAGRLQEEPVSRKVTRAFIDPDTLDALVALPPWTNASKRDVALETVTYADAGITMDINGDTLFIEADELPFKVSSVLNTFRDVFEGDTLTLHVRQRVSFRVDPDKRRLALATSDFVVEELVVDEEIIEKFAKIQTLYVTIRKVNPFLPASEVIVMVRDIMRSEYGPERDGTEEREFDQDCIRILTEMADQVHLAADPSRKMFLTSQDAWFRVGNTLIWEREMFGAATYIFCSPQVSLPEFVARVWASRLQDIRGDSTSGYQGRVIHTYDDGQKGWKRKLEDKVRNAKRRCGL